MIFICKARDSGTVRGLIILELRLIKVNRGGNILSLHLFLQVMTIRKKNRGLLLLMVSSIMLLLVLQFMWLKDAYEKQEELLSEQADILFVKTVRNLQDSLANRIFIASLEAMDSSADFSGFTMERQIQTKTTGFTGAPKQVLKIDTGSVSTVVIRTNDSIRIDWEGVPQHDHQQSIVRMKSRQDRGEGIPRFLQHVLLSFTLEDTLSRELLHIGKD